MSDITDLLPPSLNLPAHLSAHKYFFVCTLTVAAWDTLVLTPRTWRLLRTKEWPVLKIIYFFLRYFMPIEFVIVGVAFFDTEWSQSQCDQFYLFEPICTAILLAFSSLVHMVRVHAIYDKSRSILTGMGAVLAAQVVVTAICCGFYRSVPLLEGQGCIAGPKSNWVGIYWVLPTLLYTISFGLALNRSFQSLQQKPIGLWKLMLRDGLNLYGAIWGINMVNMIFWFVAQPDNTADTIKTIVTSMSAVLTTTMTMRIILLVRGSLARGGSFAGTSHASSHSRNTTHVISTRHTAGQPGGPNVLNINSQLASNNGVAQTYTLEEMRAKAERDWVADDKSSVDNGKEGILPIDDSLAPPTQNNGFGVKVTIDREVDYADKH